MQGSAQCRASPIRHGARCLESSVDSQPSSPAGRPFPGRRHAAGRSRVPPAHPLPRVSASLGAPASHPLPRALPLPTAASACWASQITCTPLARRKNQRQAALPPSGRLHPAPDSEPVQHLLHFLLSHRPPSANPALRLTGAASAFHPTLPAPFSRSDSLTLRERANHFTRLQLFTVIHTIFRRRLALP